MESTKLKRAVVKEELVALTGDFKLAIILNQMIYWSERVRDYDKFIAEEKARYDKEGREIEMDLQNGWIYKTAEELAEETMMGLSPSNMRTQIKKLVGAGYLSERTNPNLKWDRTKQYRVDIVKIQIELLKLGYALEGYSLDGAFSAISEIEKASEENEKCNSMNQKIKPHKTEIPTIQNENAIPEITTETTTDTTTHTMEPEETVESKDSLEDKDQIQNIVCVLDKKISYAEAKRILKAARGDMELIRAKYQIAKKTGYRNLMGYMLKAIEEDWEEPKDYAPLVATDSIAKKTSFHNFESRASKYSNDELEALIRAKNS
ncbi:hypothetical protein EUAN_07180 [Andreesenia angusta]|uniref:Uncharacterized protein n=1 Tax=Andreesenia angusta TaxID=39480 RepID=A0A1S1V8V0_9FIRM|nr:hypothetical protein [Andreesenia angusta]OHW62934.1 hypothetical protein EUAN_07180 [Andreesenia angusta]